MEVDSVVAAVFPAPVSAPGVEGDALIMTVPVLVAVKRFWSVAT